MASVYEGKVVTVTMALRVTEPVLRRSGCASAADEKVRVKVDATHVTLFASPRHTHSLSLLMCALNIMCSYVLCSDDTGFTMDCITYNLF